MTEQQIQAKSVLWLWNTHPETRGLFFAVNNNSEHVARAMQRKAIGLVKGVSDTIFLWQGKTYLIEFKTEKGRQSEAQQHWQGKVQLHGFTYVVVRSVGEFQEFITSIL